MLSYGKMARSSAPASKRTHVQGAFGTERAQKTLFEVRDAQRKRVSDFERAAQASRPTPESDLLAHVYTSALMRASDERAMAATATNASDRLLHNFIADAILQGIAARAYSGEPQD